MKSQTNTGYVAFLSAIRDKMELVKRSGAFAVAMDIDAAGLPFLQNLNPPDVYKRQAVTVING